MDIDLPWLVADPAQEAPAPPSAVGHMEGTPLLMARLLYSTGMRLMECVGLRVKDVDFSRHEIVVRDGKGGKDQMTMLPESLIADLEA